MGRGSLRDYALPQPPGDRPIHYLQVNLPFCPPPRTGRSLVLQGPDSVRTHLVEAVSPNRNRPGNKEGGISIFSVSG